MYSEKMLSTPMAKLIHNIFAIPRTIEGNVGKTLRMRRYNRLQTAPVPVDPLFMNPPAQIPTMVDIDCTVNWYATQLIVTREVDKVAPRKKPALNTLENLKAA
jgi:hypothetical protein